MKILRYRSVKKIAAAGVMLFMWIGSTMAVPVYAGTPNVEIQIPVSVQGAAGTIVLEPEKAYRTSDRKRREAKLWTDTL